ncbi:hypothetical protein [Commensalibacter oyaizuii]|uniref:Uncharacterized protein n=1 Tax=Commensalibacter oyaizuii TaxID=3043873 RepID=A0ABT6Q3A5_9PROT|nr:hypothetical protein [Commensalibacter sp. TBRC 16381]MDI2091597.1 hypothetical protein [Commensalibacter sp. TBRC 16381]
MRPEIFVDKVFINSIDDNLSKLMVKIDCTPDEVYYHYPEYIWCPLFLGKLFWVRFQRKAFLDYQMIYEATDFSEKEPDENDICFQNTRPRRD